MHIEKLNKFSDYHISHLNKLLLKYNLKLNVQDINIWSWTAVCVYSK